MPITYTICKAVITQESAEQGDIADQWLEGEETAETFSGLVDLLEHCDTSSFPPDSTCWYFNRDEDFRTGEETETSYHPKDDRARRWMFKAWCYSNAQRQTIDIEYEGFTNQDTFCVWFTINNHEILLRQALAAVEGRIMSGELATIADDQGYWRRQAIRYGLDSIDWRRVNWAEIWEYFEAIAKERMNQ